MTNSPDETTAEAPSIYSCDPKTIHAYLVLAAEENPLRIRTALARVIACTMMADTAFLLSMPDENGRVEIYEGFDYPNEEMIHGGFVDETRTPTLVENLKSAQPMRLILENDDLLQLPALSKILSIPEPGGLLMVPLLTPEQKPVGGILLLSPYNHKQWSFQDQIYLTAMVDTIASVLQRIDRVAELQKKVDILSQPPEETPSSSLEQVSDQAADPRQVFDKLVNASEDESMIKNDLIIEDLVARQAELEAEISNLREENEKLRAAAIQSSHAPDSKDASINGELNLTLDALADEQKKVKDALDRLNDYDRLSAERKLLLPPQVEQYHQYLRDLNSPLSAINGYVDLLFGESIGALTPVQKRFLERIKTAAQRIDKILNELRSGFESGDFSKNVESAPIGLKTVITQALESVEPILQEKTLTIDQDFPEDGLLIHNQPDLIQKIMNASIQLCVEGAQPADHIQVKLAAIPEDKPVQLWISLRSATEELDEPDISSLLAEIPQAPDIDSQNRQADQISQLVADIIQAGGRIQIQSEEEHPELYIVIPLVAQEK